MAIRKRASICPGCHEAFYKLRKNQEYCRPGCRARHYAEKNPRIKAVRVFTGSKTATCPTCDAEFQTKTANHKFCSPACSLVAHTPSLGSYRIFERDGFACVYCGKTSVEDRVKLHADHIIAHKNGGRAIAGNLVTACQACNLSKNVHRLAPANLERLQRLASERNAASSLHDDMVILPGK